LASLFAPVCLWCSCVCERGGGSIFESRSVSGCFGPVLWLRCSRLSRWVFFSCVICK
jgi:hypothetical protein